MCNCPSVARKNPMICNWNHRVSTAWKTTVQTAYINVWGHFNAYMPDIKPLYSPCFHLAEGTFPLSGSIASAVWKHRLCSTGWKESAYFIFHLLRFFIEIWLPKRPTSAKIRHNRPMSLDRNIIIGWWVLEVGRIIYDVSPSAKWKEDVLLRTS